MVSENALATGRESGPLAECNRLLGEICVRTACRPVAVVTVRLVWIALVCLGLAACSEPFPTTPPAVVDKDTGKPLGDLISFCYGTEMNGPEEIKAVAEERCEGRLVFVEQNMFFNGCPLLQIARVTYQCLPSEPEEAAGSSSVPRP